MFEWGSSTHSIEVSFGTARQTASSWTYGGLRSSPHLQPDSHFSHELEQCMCEMRSHRLATGVARGGNPRNQWQRELPGRSLTSHGNPLKSRETLIHGESGVAGIDDAITSSDTWTCGRRGTSMDQIAEFKESQIDLDRFSRPLSSA